MSLKRKKARLQMFRDRPMELSNLLADTIGYLFFNDCEYPSHCCCFVWDLQKAGTFSSESLAAARILQAFRGKPDFMKLMVNYGFLPSLPEESPLLVNEMSRNITRFM